MAITPIKLSGSTNGRPIAVAATATPGTLIHTAQASTTLLDVIEITASNQSASDVTLTLEWGGVAAGDQKKIIVPANSQVPIPRGCLNNSLILRAFAGTGSVINIDGLVEQMS